MVATITARLCRRSPLSDLTEITIMFQTLVCQYLNKLSDRIIRRVLAKCQQKTNTSEKLSLIYR